jgi:hypothetical protein
MTNILYLPWLFILFILNYDILIIIFLFTVVGLVIIKDYLKL